MKEKHNNIMQVNKSVLCFELVGQATRRNDIQNNKRDNPTGKRNSIFYKSRLKSNTKSMARKRIVVRFFACLDIKSAQNVRDCNLMVNPEMTGVF